MPSSKIFIPAIERINAFTKMIICIVVGIATSLLMVSSDMNTLTRVMIGWDAFCIGMLIFGLITISSIDSRQIRQIAAKEDPKRMVVFTMILISTIASILAVTMLILAKKDSMAPSIYQLPVGVAGMILSWFLIHTTFTLRYAHMYYGDSEDETLSHAGGLDFPGEEKPEYIDFAYYSFVLGMTFQVSDVEITSRAFRRMALLQGMISFFFSTIMIALTINVIGN